MYHIQRVHNVRRSPHSSLGLPWLPHPILLRCEGAPAQERRQGHGDTPEEAGGHHDHHQPPLVLPHWGTLQGQTHYNVNTWLNTEIFLF